MIVLCVIIAAESISRIKIKKMSKEIEDLKSDMKSKMKSKQEEHDEHISAKDKEISNVKLQLDGKENEVSVLSTVIEELNSQPSESKPISAGIILSLFSIVKSITPIPEPDPNETKKMGKRVEWIRSDNSSVKLISPAPLDCISVVNELMYGEMRCNSIDLYSSSPEAAIMLLSSIHQTGVKKLRVENTLLTKDMIYCINQAIYSNQLEKIHLRNTALSTTGSVLTLANAISGNRSLKRLELNNNRSLTDDDMYNISQILVKNATLQELYLYNCNITDNGARHLVNALAVNKTLKRLNISGNTSITSTPLICEMISGSTSLSHLYVNHVSLPADDSILQLMAALSANDTIRRLSIDKNHKENCEGYDGFIFMQHKIHFQ
jgi:hypothetical protein